MKGFLIIAVLAITTSVVFADFSVCKDKKVGEHVNHPDTCEKFVVCIDGGVAVNCPPGTHFNKDLGVCDWLERAGCESSDKTSLDSDSDLGSNSGSSAYATSCKGQPLGRRVNHPDSCEKFVVCIGGGVSMDCPSGLHFNKDLEVCDWLERAGCA